MIDFQSPYNEHDFIGFYKILFLTLDVPNHSLVDTYHDRLYQNPKKVCQET